MTDELPDFIDGDQAKAWLLTQARWVSEVIAVRAALRVFPVLILAEKRLGSELAPALVLPVLQATASSFLANGLTSKGEAQQARAAARAAAFATTAFTATTAARAAADAAARAADAARAATTTTAAADAAFAAADDAAVAAFAAATAARGDVAAFAAADAAAASGLSQEDVLRLPLWPSPDGREAPATPTWAADTWTALCAHLDAREGEVWRVWTDWYQDRLDGKPIDWELERARLQPPEVSEAGPKVLNEAIAARLADYLSRKTPLAEDLVPNPNTGAFDVHSREIARPDLLSSTLAHVADALEDALANPSNGLNEGSLETRRLRRVMERYANDPQRIEMDLTTTHALITGKIATEELPASDENNALLSTMQDCAQGIRATTPEVAENRRILQEQALRELSDDQVQIIEDAAPLLDAITEGDLRDQMQEDVLFLTQEMRVGPPLAAATSFGRDEAVRVFGRSARMSSALRRAPELLQKIEATTVYRAAGLLLMLDALVTLGLKLLF